MPEGARALRDSLAWPPHTCRGEVQSGGAAPLSQSEKALPEDLAGAHPAREGGIGPPEAQSYVPRAP